MVNSENYDSGSQDPDAINGGNIDDIINQVNQMIPYDLNEEVGREINNPGRDNIQYGLGNERHKRRREERHDNQSRSTDSDRQNQINENLNREIARLTEHINDMQMRHQRERDQWEEEIIRNQSRGRRENVVEAGRRSTNEQVNAVTKSIRLADVTFNGDVKRTNPRWFWNELNLFLKTSL